MFLTISRGEISQFTNFRASTWTRNWGGGEEEQVCIERERERERKRKQGNKESGEKYIYRNTIQRASISPKEQKNLSKEGEQPYLKLSSALLHNRFAQFCAQPIRVLFIMLGWTYNRHSSYKNIIVLPMFTFVHIYLNQAHSHKYKHKLSTNYI